MLVCALLVLQNPPYELLNAPSADGWIVWPVEPILQAINKRSIRVFDWNVFTVDAYATSQALHQRFDQAGKQDIEEVFDDSVTNNKCNTFQECFVLARKKESWKWPVKQRINY